jgi:hypothetical protein
VGEWEVLLDDPVVLGELEEIAVSRGSEDTPNPCVDSRQEGSESAIGAAERCRDRDEEHCVPAGRGCHRSVPGCNRRSGPGRCSMGRDRMPVRGPGEIALGFISHQISAAGTNS